ncbi:MAG: hypothetical protein H6858_01185 [Rhodospirillales bacterium]|nr:hypothetical protein [Alphaproteobacteria bacterium]MCB1839244.1 hypothetical protein [Alphaproteobacteria bacterium]MCB9976194.1 hypothetical protein [Rhodospirillales bacterium]
MNENFEEETLPPEEHVAEETPALKKKKAGSMPFQGYSKYVQDIDAIEEEVKLWLVTITDVVALMLTFFVLTYAMSRPEEDKWKQISASLSSEFTKSYGKPYFAGPLDTITIDKVDLARALGLPYLKGLIEEVYAKQDIKDYAINQQRDRLIVSLPADVIIENSSPEQKAESRAALIALGDVLARIKNRVEVVAHADPKTVSGTGAEPAEGWSFSLDRATQVANFMHRNGYGKEIVVRGLSSARTEEGTAEPDRVDIVILRDNGIERELLIFEQP